MISFRRYLLSASAIASVLSIASGAVQATALPSGGHYVSGKGEIGKAGQSLTVKQSSTTGIIDWNKFSIGSKNAVTFDNGSGATLNRVTGGNLSTIAGSLHATGSLYLLNSNGMIVSGSGKVVTGGSLIASSGFMSNDTFGSDDPQRFRNAKAAIINQGTILSGGSVRLIGSSVANSGVIDAARASIRAEDGDTLDTGTIRATGNAHYDAHILVVSETGKTKITGDLVARNRDGSGGTVETSGRNIVIGGTIDTGEGGRWIVDPYNLTVTASAAKTIDKSLDDGANVTLKTTLIGTSGPGKKSAGAGDLDIEAALSWDTAAKLTLDAYHSIQINAPITVAGKGAFVLTTDYDGGQGGEYDLGSGDAVNFGKHDNGGALVINGVSFKLLYSAVQVQEIDESNKALHGSYALATSISAKSLHGWVPIGTNGDGEVTNLGNGFAGVFEGLGNIISNLNVSLPSVSDVGLFGYSSGTIRDIGIIKSAVRGYENIGELVGESYGSVIDDYAKGKVSGFGWVGGLIGFNDNDTISEDYATAEVRGAGGWYIGGLVGFSVGAINHCYATGAVSGGTSDGKGAVGGLAGEVGSISNSYATGAVSGSGNIDQLGGLAGAVDYSITNSYATGTVSGGANSDGVGGLAGGAGSIVRSYATGNVSGGNYIGGLAGGATSITNSYAMGNVGGENYVGGLVGDNSGNIRDSYAVGTVSGGANGAGIGGLAGLNDTTGSIDDSYATGTVTGGANSDGVGGLVGEYATNGSSIGLITNSYATGNVSGGNYVGGLIGLVAYTSITDSYSSGAVSATDGSAVGGLIGSDGGGGIFSDDYWDTTTSGVADLSQGAGNISNDPGIIGLTTTELQSGLPSGFKKSIWTENASINDGLPYLKSLASSY